MNDDYNLDDEEIQPQAEDEYSQYLVDEVTEDPEEAKRIAEEKEADRLQAIVDRKIAERFMVEKPKPTPPPQSTYSPAPASQESPEALLDKLAEEITNDLAIDPKAAVRKVLAATRTMTDRSVASSAAQANRIMVEQYRNSRSSDPIFQAIQDDFNSEVSTYTDEVLGKATPDQVRRALKLAEESALGRHYLKLVEEKATKRQAAPPPNYGSGRSAGGSATQTRTLTASQRELVKMGRNAGLDDKAIRELVKENS